MSIRDVRMEKDYLALQKLCVFHEREKIKILETQGQPPQFYRLQISNCQGIEAVINGSVKYRTEHILTIRDFPLNYPEPGCLPSLQMETPMFHPNVYHNGLIDLGVSELREINHSLDYLVTIVIIMIQYKNLNFGCPANLAAKDWANKNKNLFPLSGSESDGKQSNSPQIKWK
ncbi:MAG: hypothetical protein EAZ09_23150 [Oscillatoriales cyanobacterium]|nr:MAG: hypothetical protein EAZ18_19535 [Oscillatoriales cyanobacterium]TAH15842.1 MAG: hypothetical protein EAZ09_23150 [Oscillatoriales cyanobacterium]